MEKSKSKNEGLFQPSNWPDSRSGNLPEVFASDAVEVAVEGERRKGERCFLPPIVQPTRPTIEKTGDAIGRPGSFNDLAQNDRCENLNDYKSRRFLNSRPVAIVTDGKVPNRREPMVEGLVRRDAAFVSTGQQATVTEHHLRALRLDTKKSRNEKTVFQRRNGSFACPTSENVIIEEIYLLPLNKRAVPMEQKSQRQGICNPLSLRETRSDESNGVREIHRFGEILSRSVYYGGSATDLSSLEEFGSGMDMAKEPRRQSGIRCHQSLRKTRSEESNGFGEIRPCGKICSHRLAATSNASLHVNEKIGREVNMTEETRAERSDQRRKGQQIRKEIASEDNSEAASAAESEQERRPQLQGVNEAEEEAKSGEEESFACVVTAESVNRQRQRRRHKGVNEANIETRDSKREENLACGVTAELVEKQEQRRRHQRASKANIETRDSKEEGLPCDVTAGVAAESIEKQEQRRRRDGVCETVDKTAARRRRAKVLRKKLFGEDLPVDYELMIEHTIGRVLNKRL